MYLDAQTETAVWSSRCEDTCKKDQIFIIDQNQAHIHILCVFKYLARDVQEPITWSIS
jgi:hypothetical protein